MQHGEFNLNVIIGNDSMQEPRDLADALRMVGEQLIAGEIGDFIRDANGNPVGRWDVSLTDVCPVCGDPEHD